MKSNNYTFSPGSPSTEADLLHRQDGKTEKQILLEDLHNKTSHEDIKAHIIDNFDVFAQL